MTPKMTTESSTSPDEVAGWFAGRLPDEWFLEPPTVQVDRDEVLVVGPIPTPAVAEPDTDDARRAAEAARVVRFREDTRSARMRIADEAEARWGRKVSWGVECGAQRQLFTTQAVPVMSRLRMPERMVLDTLIDAGVARSRSEALAWCVRLVGTHEGEWIEQLRAAVARVHEVRAEGPGAAS